MSRHYLSRHHLFRHPAVLALSVLVFCCLAFTAVGQDETATAAEAGDATAAEAPAAPAADSAQIERGRYIVTGVSMCGECHTPRNASGELQMNHWLMGASIPVTTPEGYRSWVYKAPRIADLPQHTDEQFVTLMTTGINRDGMQTRSPMPQFRMSEEDALAIAAYLRSLD